MAPDLARALADGDAEIDWPGGETAASLAERVASAWDALSRLGRRRRRRVARRSAADRDGPRAAGAGKHARPDRARRDRAAAGRRRPLTSAPATQPGGLAADQPVANAASASCAIASTVFGPSPLARVTAVAPKPDDRDRRRERSGPTASAVSERQPVRSRASSAPSRRTRRGNPGRTRGRSPSTSRRDRARPSRRARRCRPRVPSIPAPNWATRDAASVRDSVSSSTCPPNSAASAP